MASKEQMEGEKKQSETLLTIPIPFVLLFYHVFLYHVFLGMYFFEINKNEN